MNKIFLYTRKQLFEDLNKEVIDENKGVKNPNSWKPVELKYLIRFLETSDIIEDGTSELSKPFTNLLYSFSLFVSSHRDYKYNKGYLNGCIKKFPDFVVKCGLFFDHVVNHFNLLMQSVSIDLCRNYIIAYDDILHFRYIHDEQVWCAYLNPDKLNHLPSVNIDKLHFELLCNNYAVEFVLSISIGKEKSGIREIESFLSKHHL